MACEPLLASPKPYEYQQLNNPSVEVRLLELQFELARLPDGQEVPQGSLAIVRLPVAQHYMALSYCWGDATDTTMMLLDGKSKRITRNLSNYLHQKVEWMQELRYDGCICWIDAISINQDDDEEKSHQVQVMRKIFGNASAVDAWVGPANRDTPAAFECMRQLRNIVGDFCHAFPDVGLASEQALLDVLSYLFAHLSDQVIPLHDLVTREWWRRIWVQQEIMSASIYNITLVCGSTRISWAYIRLLFGVSYLAIPLAMSLKRRNISPEQHGPLAKRLIDMYARMLPYVWIHPEVPIDGHDSENVQKLIWRLLSNSILGSRGARATLLVDHVYGVLGIISDKAAVSEYIQVDYSKPATHVFTQVARYLYNAYPRLMLSLALETGMKSQTLDVEGLTENLKFPSWAIDWTIPRAYPLTWEVMQDTNWLWVSNALYHASADFDELYCAIYNDRLHLRGFPIDLVSSSGSDHREAFRLATLDTNHKTSWLRAYDEFMRCLFEFGDPSKEDMLWRLPTADRELVTNGSAYGQPTCTKRASRCMMAAFQEVLSFAKNETNKSDGIALSNDAEAYLHLIEYLMINRAPFMTKKGRAGVGPVATNTDDFVFILSGFDAPFLFRKLDTGQYTLIGECYLHGVMDGEAVTEDVVLEVLEVF